MADLRDGWKKLKKLSQDVTDNLGRLQVGFKRRLVKEVKAFVNDAKTFRNDFEANGPMVPGLAPMEAVGRLKKYQSAFATKKHKWNNFIQGEELFRPPPSPSTPSLRRRSESLSFWTSCTPSLSP